MAFGALLGTLSGNATSIANPTDATGSVVVAVGDLVFGVVGEQTTLTSTGVTDNLGNTYAATNAGTDAGTSTGRAFYSRVTVAGTLTAVHFAASSSTDNAAVFAAVIAGPFAVSPLDANPANITSDITSPFTCPATGTLTQTNEVVIAWGVATGSTVWAATSPNLLAGQIATASILHTVIGHQLTASTASVTPAFTAGSNPTDAVLGTSSFKAPPLTSVTLIGAAATTSAGSLGRTITPSLLPGVTYWKFDENTGTSLGDAVDSNIGTFQGTTGSQWITGVSGSALHFNGSDNYVSTTNNITSPTAFSISLSFRTSTASGHKIIGFEDVQTGTAAVNFDRHLYIGTDGKLYFGVHTSTLVSLSTVDDGNWHQVIATYDGTNGVLWLDNIQQSSGVL